MKSSNIGSNPTQSWPQRSHVEADPRLETQSHSTNSNDCYSKSSKFQWLLLADVLNQSRELKETFVTHLNILNVSKKTLRKFKHVPQIIKDFIIRYGNQNCIRAVSIVEDLTNVKKNQYKFLYRGLTLASAIDLLMRESLYLWKSIVKQNASAKHFSRLICSWIDAVFLIHSVPLGAQEELKSEILTHVWLLNERAQ
jgi:hypothetical protein